MENATLVQKHGIEFRNGNDKLTHKWFDTREERDATAQRWDALDVNFRTMDKD